MGQLFGVAALVRAMAARMAVGEMSSADAITFGAVVAEEVGAFTPSASHPFPILLAPLSSSSPPHPSSSPSFLLLPPTPSYSIIIPAPPSSST
jgi:hypothetical protein